MLLTKYYMLSKALHENYHYNLYKFLLFCIRNIIKICPLYFTTYEIVVAWCFNLGFYTRKKKLNELYFVVKIQYKFNA